MLACPCSGVALGPPPETLTGVSSQRDFCAGVAPSAPPPPASAPGAGVLSHALVAPARPGVGVSSQRLPRDGVALTSPTRPGVGVLSQRLPPSAPRPGVGVLSQRLPPSAPRPGVGVASHLLPAPAAAPRPGVGVASHLLLAAARPGVGVESHLLASATRPGVGVASHLLPPPPPPASRPGVGVESHLDPTGAGVATSSQRVACFLPAAALAPASPAAGASQRRRFLTPVAPSSDCSASLRRISSFWRAMSASAITSRYDRSDDPPAPLANGSARDGESTRCLRAWYSSSRSAMRLERWLMGSSSSGCCGTASSRCFGAVNDDRFAAGSAPSSCASPGAIDVSMPAYRSVL
mmetsp:Transcript_16136/g.48586  ORF Transcript_16136/g.48586 Transcript_16136/m.48586 type:complete len:351 (-) Transcript_16136:160-1212(-)